VYNCRFVRWKAAVVDRCHIKVNNLVRMERGGDATRRPVDLVVSAGYVLPIEPHGARLCLGACDRQAG
jgi:hypothetical protein